MAVRRKRGDGQQDILPSPAKDKLFYPTPHAERQSQWVPRHKASWLHFSSQIAIQRKDFPGQQISLRTQKAGQVASYQKASPLTLSLNSRLPGGAWRGRDKAGSKQRHFEIRMQLLNCSDSWLQQIRLLENRKSRGGGGGLLFIKLILMQFAEHLLHARYWALCAFSALGYSNPKMSLFFLLPFQSEANGDFKRFVHFPKDISQVSIVTGV